MKFDAVIIKDKQSVNIGELVTSLVSNGIDIACVAGEFTANPGFEAQKLAEQDFKDKILIIPGAVVNGTGGMPLLVIGAVNKIVVPTKNDTLVLSNLVRLAGGALIALNPQNLVDSPYWTMIDASVVWYDHVLYPRTVPVSLAITGCSGKIGEVYTDVDESDMCYKSLTKLMLTNPEKFVPIIARSRIL